MSSFFPSPKPDSPRRTHDPGAFAAWGLIGGAVLGAAVGTLFEQRLLTALVLGAVGWIVGALLDRRRQ